MSEQFESGGETRINQEAQHIKDSRPIRYRDGDVGRVRREGHMVKDRVESHRNVPELVTHVYIPPSRTAGEFEA